MNRRYTRHTKIVWTGLACFALAVQTLTAQTLRVATIAGNGVAGFSDTEINNPYGVVIGPDKALYFCDLDNQRINLHRMLITNQFAQIAGCQLQSAPSSSGGVFGIFKKRQPQLTLDQACNPNAATASN